MITKRFSITLICLLITAFAFAGNKNLEKDVTMEFYEQSWLNFNATIALKNNTTEEIKNVVFVLTYLDMSGKELDYEEFHKRVNIEPGKTRKIDIQAYEHSRNYHYYKSKGSYSGDETAFKIKFKLKDYNVEDKEYYYAAILYLILTSLPILITICIIIGLFAIVAVMARKRRRSILLWLLISFIASPILAIIILLVIGESENL